MKVSRRKWTCSHALFIPEARFYPSAILVTSLTKKGPDYICLRKQLVFSGKHTKPPCNCLDLGLCKQKWKHVTLQFSSQIKNFQRCMGISGASFYLCIYFLSTSAKLTWRRVGNHNLLLVQTYYSLQSYKEKGRHVSLQYFGTCSQTDFWSVTVNIAPLIPQWTVVYTDK